MKVVKDTPVLNEKYLSISPDHFSIISIISYKAFIYNIQLHRDTDKVLCSCKCRQEKNNFTNRKFTAILFSSEIVFVTQN